MALDADPGWRLNLALAHFPLRHAALVRREAGFSRDVRGWVCADVQFDDGGVVDGEDVGAGKGPAGGVPAGPWCACWRSGGQSAVTSAAAARALDSSTMALRSA